MSNDITCVFQGLGPIGAIYISDAKAANNFMMLQKLNIKAVLTAAKGKKIEYPSKIVQKYLYLELEDTQKFDLERYFEQTFQFIEKARKNMNVLIHCDIGASRSVSIVIAYLIKKYNYSLSQIFTLIKRKRSRIQPNPGFIRQLQKYSARYSVKSENINFESLIRKPKIKRSLSLVAKSSLQRSQLFNSGSKIKSEELQAIKQRIRIGFETDQQQKVKIEDLLKQRQQIESKLRNLSIGLIRGTDSPRKIKYQQRFTNSGKHNDKNSIQNDSFVSMDQNRQNSNPNLPFSTFNKQSQRQKVNTTQFKTNISKY